MKIVIAELNIKNSYEDFYSGTRKFYTEWHKELINGVQENMKDKEIEVSIVYDFKELEQKLEDNKFEKCIVLSNFPGNNTYKRYKLKSDKNGVRSSIPGGYERTFFMYRKLLDNNFNLDLHIVTGAPKSMLFDSEIRLLSKYHKITILHRSELKSSPYKNYVDFIVKTAEQTE